MAPIDVITPCKPEHLHLLPEAIYSVRSQTLQPRQHLVAVDYEGAGAGFMRNRMRLGCMSFDWLAFLDADDLFYPDHLEKLYHAAMEQNADIAYSLCDYPPNSGFRFPITELDIPTLRDHNYIPVTVLMRSETFDHAGGFKVTAPYEDWDLWLRCLDIHAKFAFVPEVTWAYRLHGNPWQPSINIKEHSSDRRTSRPA